MHYTFANMVKRSKRFKSMSSAKIVPKSELDPYYNHFTLEVSSLSEYIEVISILDTIHRHSNFGVPVFRGHSDSSSKYKIIPTLGRKERHVEIIENLMVKEMINLRPEEFESIKSDFDLLSKLQHYGLPTRMLDFTYNPLIALFFACAGEKATDCRVICTEDVSDSSSLGLIDKICGMYRCDDYHTTSLDRFLGGIEQMYRYSYKTRYPLMAKPKYSNDRIKHQAAVFMIFPNAVIDRRSLMVIEGKKHGNEDEYRRFRLTKEEEKRLEYVRKEPDVYKGDYLVNSDTMLNLFKHYKNTYSDFMNEHNNEISEKYHFLFYDRFDFVDMIQELNDKEISNMFFSIIIRAKHRRKIAEDLAAVGIDKAFVFPELEYTAELVKNWYFTSGWIH